MQNGRKLYKYGNTDDSCNSADSTGKNEASKKYGETLVNNARGVSNDYSILQKYRLQQIYEEHFEHIRFTNTHILHLNVMRLVFDGCM